jgi:hypothetical protein
MKERFASKHVCYLVKTEHETYAACDHFTHEVGEDVADIVHHFLPSVSILSVFEDRNMARKFVDEMNFMAASDSQKEQKNEI